MTVHIMSLTSWTICFLSVWALFTAMVWFKLEFLLALTTAAGIAMMSTPMLMILSLPMQLFGLIPAVWIVPVLVFVMLGIRLFTPADRSVWASQDQTVDKTEIKDGKIVTTTFNREL